MKISKIEFENFRNFKDHGEITFPTDGGITVIYGPNGVGKTTLHQLFQWIIYGEVHFNKTASNKMYNLEFEQDTGFHNTFSVFGAVDFEHPNTVGEPEYYSLRREWIYRKEQNESRVITKKIKLSKKIGDDWKTVSEKPEDVIEMILPGGLSQYFFFDGESMIADLNQKGRDSAKSLRRALYSIFDLDIYEQALVHIGDLDGGKSTVLGALYLNRAECSTSNDVVVARGEYNQAQKWVEDLTAQEDECVAQIEKYGTMAKELSEKIGSNPSQEELERRRKTAKGAIKAYEDAIEKEMKSFGGTVMRNYPELFLSRIVGEAQMRIGLKVEDEELLPGLTKELVLSLLNEKTCLCGNPLHDRERAALEELRKMFPPLSYKYIYEQFKKDAGRWSVTYDNEVLVKHLQAIFQYKDQIGQQQKELKIIDEEQRQGENVDELINQRAAAEEQQRKWSDRLKTTQEQLGVKKQIKKQRRKKLDELLSRQAAGESLAEQIEIMEAVQNYYATTLKNSAEQYSAALKQSIQELLSRMLTSTRQVNMTEKFELSVRDSFGDEAKSEGQFAVVSFAYIGGIFKLLNDVPELRSKEFPLVLDGPFSKLDRIQRQNVIDTIPAYAPQVILFSKDDLNDCFRERGVENIWTIYSNAERNVSRVERGYNPEVFNVDGTNN